MAIGFSYCHSLWHNILVNCANSTNGSLSIVIYLRLLKMRSSIDSTRTLVSSIWFDENEPEAYAHDWNPLSCRGLWWKVFEAEQKLVTIIKCSTKLVFYLQIDLDYCILIYLKIADNDVDSLIFRYKYFVCIINAFNCTHKCPGFLFSFSNNENFVKKKIY